MSSKQVVDDYSQVARPGILPVSEPNSMVNILPPQAMVLLSILSAQLGAAIAKNLLATNSAFSIVLLRTGFAAIVLWLVARPQMRQYSQRQWLHAAALGIVIAGLSLAFYESVSRIPLGITMTIEFLGPLMVAVAGSRKAKDLIWPVLALGGILLLAPTGNLKSLSLAGMAFAFVAAAGWAAYLILAKRTTTIFSGTSGLTLAMTFGALSILPFGLLSGGRSLLDFSLLMNGFWVSMLSTMMPLSLEFFALKRMTPRTFGILVSADPSVAALIGVIVLHEHLSARAWAALVLVSIATLGVMSQSEQT
ncbi:MAG TPA: EamA family transporter [Candidatus Angelobacter sp.]|nr:EamA family transporter [Candidatus Angelobacter sp.]